MIPRHAWAVVVLLALVSPVLAFPQSFGPSHGWQAAAIGIAALCVATALFTGLGGLAVFAGALSLAAVIGWSRSPDHWASLNHFCGLALGLLAMGTVAVWCRTRITLAVGALVFLLIGFTALTVGFRSVRPYGNKVLVGDPAGRPGPLRPLPLPALHSRTEVNPNALAATALLILPVALAVAMTPTRLARLGMFLRAAGLLTFVWAAIVVVLTQSRSAWVAAVFIGWLVMRRRIGDRAWWLSAAVFFLVLPVTLVLLGRTSPAIAGAVQSISARKEYWIDGMQALRSSPWLGIGFDYFRYSGFSVWEYAPRLYAGAPHAHNIFLQTALDVGLVGLAGYLALMGLILRRARDVVTRRGGDEWVRYIGVGAALSVVSVHVFGLLDAVPLGAKVGIFQWLASGLVLAAWRMSTPSEGT